MQNTVHGDACPPSGPPQHIRDRIVSDLGFLMTQIQASMRLIDAAMACELSSGDEELPANVVVLDDVTPRYARANAALNTCRTELGTALHVLQDALPSQRPAAEQVHPLTRSLRGQHIT